MSEMFSIIIPVFNAEKYLNECVASIIEQDYQNYEIVLVDDGSTDRSPEICDDLSLRNPGIIRTIHQLNGGQFLAREIGIKHAQGDYLVFVDADDMLEKHALSHLYQIYTEHHVDMVIYRLFSVDRNGAFLKPSESVFERGLVSKDLLLHRMVTTGKLNSICIKSFIRKEYTFDLSHRVSHGEDLCMSLMILDDIMSIWYEPEALYRYRHNAVSITHGNNVYSYKDYLYVADYVINYINTRNLDKKMITEYLAYFTRIIRVSLSNVCLGKTEDMYAILAEIRQDERIIQCESFIRYNRLRDYIPLHLFYYKRFRLLVLYEKVFCCLSLGFFSVKKRIFSERPN